MLRRRSSFRAVSRPLSRANEREGFCQTWLEGLKSRYVFEKFANRHVEWISCSSCHRRARLLRSTRTRLIIYGWSENSLEIRELVDCAVMREMLNCLKVIYIVIYSMLQTSSYGSAVTAILARAGCFSPNQEQ